MRNYIFVFFLLSSLPALADNSYYETSCEQQAVNMEMLTKLRDKELSKIEIIKNIRDNNPLRHHDTLVELLETVLTLKSHDPKEIYLTTKNNCENYGKTTKQTPFFSNPGIKSRGTLSDDGKNSCMDIHQTLISSREKLTLYERDLDSMNSELEISIIKINSKRGFKYEVQCLVNLQA